MTHIAKRYQGRNQDITVFTKVDRNAWRRTYDASALVVATAADLLDQIDSLGLNPVDADAVRSVAMQVVGKERVVICDAAICELVSALSRGNADARTQGMWFGDICHDWQIQQNAIINSVAKIGGVVR